MQRREKGTGTVYQRDNGTWVGRMNLGRGENGKIKYSSITQTQRRMRILKMAALF